LGRTWTALAHEPVERHPADLPVDIYLGPARLVSVNRQRGAITPADLGEIALAGVPRLLLHTWYSDQTDSQWSPDFVYPSVELIDWLAEQGVILLGLDVPSVDAFTSADLPGHDRLAHHGIANLENLCLKGVPDGVYERSRAAQAGRGFVAALRAVLRGCSPPVSIWRISGMLT
jgi:arylformamidase